MTLIHTDAIVTQFSKFHSVVSCLFRSMSFMHCPFYVSLGLLQLALVSLSRFGSLFRMWMTTPQCLKVCATHTLYQKWHVWAPPSCRWQHVTRTMQPIAWFTTVWHRPPLTALTLGPSLSTLKLAPFSCTGQWGFGWGNAALWKYAGDHHDNTSYAIEDRWSKIWPLLSF